MAYRGRAIRARIDWSWMLVLLLLVAFGSLATEPVYLGTVIGVLAVLALALVSGLWRSAFAVTLALLVGATSHFTVVAEASYYGRYVAAGTLVAITWALPVRVPLKQAGHWLRRLVGSLWVTGILSLASATWSQVPGLTLQQGLAMLFLAAFVHALVTRRWVDASTQVGDLKVAVLVLGLSITAGLAMRALGMADALSLPTFRVRGIYENPNQTAMMSVIVVTLAWGLWLATRRRWLLLAMLVGAVGLVTAESRTSLIAAALAVTFAVLRRRGAKPVVQLALVSVAAWATIYAVLPWFGYTGATEAIAAVLRRFTANEGGSALNGRDRIWEQTIDLWQQAWLGGHGFRSGEALFAGSSLDVNVSHNSYLQALVELGVIGAVPLAMLLLCIGVALLRVPAEGLGSGLIACTMGCLVVLLTESALFGTGQPLPWVFWPVAAALVAQLNSPVPVGTRPDLVVASRPDMPR